jgi:hypothetical protein
MKLNKKEIQAVALDFLAESDGGARWSDILRHVQAYSPETPPNTIQGALHALMSRSSQVEKITRGVYQLASQVPGETLEDEAVVEKGAPTAKPTSLESEFYESFAAWLVDDAEDATYAVALGGNWLRGKWGTPDVLGVLKPRSDDLLKFEPQIVAAEIKVDGSQTVVAFGQAVSYLLFSHRSYIVVPDDISADDLARLKALCGVHGIGLVIFKRDPSDPAYRQLVAPGTDVPDMFYANRMIRQLRDANEDAYRRLFD